MASEWIDISLTIKPGRIVWPGDPEVEVVAQAAPGRGSLVSDFDDLVGLGRDQPAF